MVSDVRPDLLQEFQRSVKDAILFKTKGIKPPPRSPIGGKRRPLSEISPSAKRHKVLHAFPFSSFVFRRHPRNRVARSKGHGHNVGEIKSDQTKPNPQRLSQFWALRLELLYPGCIRRRRRG
jgi:hypothetical protein